MFATFSILFVFFALGIPAAIVLIPWSIVTKSSSAMYRIGMAITRLGVKAAGIRVRIVGLENIPANTSCIFLSNHVSNLDPPILCPLIPGQTSVLLKKQIVDIPLLGIAMKLAKFVPVSRGQSREDAARSTEAAADALRSGLHITIFPEGTRSTRGELLPFKKGAFFLAAATGAPLVPVVVKGTTAMLPKGTWKIKPGLATLEFLPPVMPADFESREELMAAVRASMEAALAR